MICANCGNPLKLGGFTYNKEICWDCFCNEFLDICNETVQPNSEQRRLLYHLMSIFAEVFGEKFKE